MWFIITDLYKLEGSETLEYPSTYKRQTALFYLNTEVDNKYLEGSLQIQTSRKEPTHTPLTMTQNWKMNWS